ncbi:MAG: Trk system potassium transporter TrkA [Acutalibacteraceae bacterium]
MDIIIVGGGKVGANLAEQLNAEGHNIVVVDNKPYVNEQIGQQLDIMTIDGSGANIDVLKEAGVENADLLIAVTNADELNLLCCLIANKAGARHTIARVRNPEYASSLPTIKDDLGLSLAINPEQITANAIARLMQFPSAIEIDTFARGSVELYKIILPQGCPLNDKRILDLTKLMQDIRICAVERDDKVCIPNGQFVLRQNDRISVIGKPRVVTKFFRKIGIINAESRNVMIVGGGTTSYYLAKKLLSNGTGVKIIDKNKERCEHLSEMLGIPIINGDGMNKELLIEEGIRDVDAFTSLTNFDEENILLSLYAKSISKAKVITKVNKLAFDEIIGNMTLGSLIQPKLLSSEYIVRYVRSMQNSFGSNVETLCKILDGKAEALEFRVRQDSPVVGVPLQDLKLMDNVLVGSIIRNGKVIIPQGTDTIEINDTVIIVTTHRQLDDIKDILKG